MTDFSKYIPGTPMVVNMPGRQGHKAELVVGSIVLPIQHVNMPPTYVELSPQKKAEATKALQDLTRIVENLESELCMKQTSIREIILRLQKLLKLELM